jgi:SAM-dependent methyltransferase
MQQAQYAPGHSERELKRLTCQAQAFEPFTRQLLQAAGIGSGMRVLDVGCGSGDVSFLLSELVGPAGEVIGVDRARAAVEWANARMRSQEIRNVTFIEGDACAMRSERVFDAVVGRLVLMYSPDPVSTLRKLAEHVREEGLVVFQEFDTEFCRSLPPAPAYERAAQWIRKTLADSGAHLQLGLELFRIFVAAGLPEPSMRFDALIGGGPDCIAYQHIAEVVETLLPEMERRGTAQVAEVGISTLANRMRDEIVSANGVALSPGLIGAWSTKRTPPFPERSAHEAGKGI